ncbi:MAG: peptidyl-tRNA hydrolase Pth2 [Anaerolineae bacterium]|nr:peptidyl-tRNA hydrolase Pth2 [Anaerolineae bacterium]
MKQVIVVNEALQLPRGKLAAQVAHAAVAALLWAEEDELNRWLDEGMPKIVLRVGSEAELLEIHAKAKAKDLPTDLIRDAGRTVVEAGTLTCVGIGPADDEAINSVTGHLSLLR